MLKLAATEDDGMRLPLSYALAALLLAAPAAAATPDTRSQPLVPTIATAMPPLYKNCTAFNKKYPHGVGQLKARDKTSGEPVTTFKRSTTIYNVAIGHNKGLDRDKDGVACETA